MKNRPPLNATARIAARIFLCLAALLTGCDDGSDAAPTAFSTILPGPRGLAICPTLLPLDPSPPANAGQQACRRAVEAGSRAYTVAVYTAEADCLARIQRGELEAGSSNRLLDPATATCAGMRELSTGVRRPPEDPRTAAAVDAAEVALDASLNAGCTTQDLAGLQLCAETPSAAAECLAGEHWEHVQHLLSQTHGQVTAIADPSVQQCQASVAHAAIAALDSQLELTSACIDTASTAGTDLSACLGAIEAGSVRGPADSVAANRLAAADRRFRDAIGTACNDTAIHQLDACAAGIDGLSGCLSCTLHREALLLAGAQFGGEQGSPTTHFIDWSALRNPILGLPNGRLKDQSMALHGDTFYLLVGPVFEERLGSVHFRSRDMLDWQAYTDTMGPDARPPGSINLTRIDDLWHAVFQTTGPGHPDDARLYHSTSDDLVNWQPGVELGAALLPGESIIDGALFRKGGFYYVVMKWREPQQPMVTRSATAEFDQNWRPAQQFVLQSPDVTFGIGPGWAENFQIIEIDGRIRLVATARDPEGFRCPNQFTCSHEPFIYELAAGSGANFEHWLTWDHKTHLRIPYEAWNRVMHANTGFINDWREHDGFFYLTYAGSLDFDSFEGRGQGKIGIARSRDLIHWRVAGDLRD